MINPCENCPRRAEYDEYDNHLEMLLLARPGRKIVKPEPEPVASRRPKKRKDADGNPVRTEGFSNKKFFKEEKRCAMIGCKKYASINGFCTSCNSLRYYHAKQGNPVPDRLSDRQIKLRRGRR